MNNTEMPSNITDIHLYSMPSMSNNNHLKFALHLTNCESSVVTKKEIKAIAHVKGKHTRETATYNK